MLQHGCTSVDMGKEGKRAQHTLMLFGVGKSRDHASWGRSMLNGDFHAFWGRAWCPPLRTADLYKFRRAQGRDRIEPWTWLKFWQILALVAT